MFDDEPRLTRYDIAAAVGAAIGQRVVIESNPAKMAALRALQGRYTLPPGDPRHAAFDKAREAAKETSEIALSATRPEGLSAAGMGRRLVATGSTGDGDSWEPGEGAEALTRLLMEASENATLNRNALYSYGKLLYGDIKMG